MAINIDTAYVESFESAVRQLAQQGITRLRPYVTEVSNQSESHNWDRLAASDARLKPGPRSPSPQGGDKPGNIFNPDVGYDEGLNWTRRKTLIATWDSGEIVEQENVVQMLIDPNSSSTVNLAMNMKRAFDDVIIAAATGDALDGDGASVTFPVGQIVGSASTLMSLDVVLETSQLFYDNDIDPDESKCFVISPLIQRKLMQLMEVTSGDYQNSKALATGYLPNWMGFEWIVSTRLLHPTAPGTDIQCLAFTKKALGLHVARDISAKVGERTDMSFAWQLYCMMSIACVRVEDEHIVQVLLKDALV